MKCGDIFLVKGTNLVSKLIRLVTNSDYSHVGLFVDDFHVYETNYNTKSGIAHLSYPDKELEIYRLPCDVDESKLEDFIKKNLRNGYDYGEILNILFRRNKPDEDNEYICSTLIVEAFRNQGINLVEGDKKVYTPKDIAESKLLIRMK